MKDKIIPIFEKHSWILRITHWLNFPLLFLMIWSGILIYWAHQPYVKIPDAVGSFAFHHRLAEGMGWHFFLMWPFALNGLIYICYLIISKKWRELFPDLKSLKSAWPYLLYDLKIRTVKPEYNGIYNPVQRIAYTGVILMAMGSLVTGLSIYKPVQAGALTALLGGYKAARFEHFMFMIGFNLFFILHVIQVLRAGWNNFRAMVAGYEIKK